MKYTKGHLTVLLVLLTTLLVAGFFVWRATIGEQLLTERNNNPARKALSVPADSSPYTDLAGNAVSLTDYIGTVIVVNSWASWSPDSVSELKLLAAVAGEYPQGEVQVLAINRAESAVTAERFLKHIGAFTDVLLVLDPDDRYYASIAGYAMPETVFYDATGNVVQHAHGVLTEELLRSSITKALESK